LTLPEEAICYVIDSHRPYRLENAFDENQILILDDGRTPEESLDQYRQSVLVESEQRRANEEEDDDAGDEDDNDNDNDDDDDVHNDQGENAAFNRGGGGGGGGARKKRSSQLQLERRKRRRVVRRRVARVFREPKLNRAYYEMTSFGLPVSFVAYELLSQLGKTSNELLWLAIVGSHRPVRARARVRGRLQRRRLALHTTERCSASTTAAAAATPAVRAAHRIVRQDEFDLMLLRHWTLYDSLVHSRYVATRLGAWKERVAPRRSGACSSRWGLPLDQCREPYATMARHVQGAAGRPPRRVCARASVCRGCATRRFTASLGFKQGVSAADVVHAVTALLGGARRRSSRRGNARR
jgi:cell division control protein 45